MNKKPSELRKSATPFVSLGVSKDMRPICLVLQIFLASSKVAFNAIIIHLKYFFVLNNTISEGKMYLLSPIVTMSAASQNYYFYL